MPQSQATPPVSSETPPIEAGATSAPKVSGSETRQRPHVVSFRMKADEYQTLKERAEAASVSAGDYVRAAYLKAEPLRAARRVTPDREAVLLLLAAVNRLGNNVNQIALRLHRDRTVYAEEIPRMTQALETMRDAIVDVLERKGKPSNDNQPQT